MAERTVRLLNYPIQLAMDNAEHVAGWMREFQLMRLDAESTSRRDVPVRLQEMVQQLTASYATEISEADRVRSAAAARGETHLDAEYPLTPQIEQVVVRWQAMCREVDAFCADAQLLTLQRPPELVEYGDWLTEEFVRQARGEEPIPWHGGSGRALRLAGRAD